MVETTLSYQQVAQNFADATRKAEAGPVVITTDDEPSHVLLTIDTYKRLISKKHTIAELFHYPGAAEIAFDP